MKKSGSLAKKEPRTSQLRSWSLKFLLPSLWFRAELLNPKTKGCRRAIIRFPKMFYSLPISSLSHFLVILTQGHIIIDLRKRERNTGGLPPTLTLTGDQIHNLCVYRTVFQSNDHQPGLNLDEKLILHLPPFRSFLGRINEAIPSTQISDSPIKVHFKSLLMKWKL